MSTMWVGSRSVDFQIALLDNAGSAFSLLLPAMQVHCKAEGAALPDAGQLAGLTLYRISSFSYSESHLHSALTASNSSTQLSTSALFSARATASACCRTTLANTSDTWTHPATSCYHNTRTWSLCPATSHHHSTCICVTHSVCVSFINALGLSDGVWPS